MKVNDENSRIRIQDPDPDLPQNVIDPQHCRWGWSSDTAGDHDVLSCSCIHLAFNFFTSKERPHSAQKKPSQHFGDWNADVFTYYATLACSVIADKVFIAGFLDKDHVNLKVIDRLEPNTQSRFLGTLALELHHQVHLNIVETAACDHLLAVLIGSSSARVAKVSLWNVEDETWLVDLDIKLSSHENVHDLAMSKNLLAVTVENFINKVKRVTTLFWQLNTSQPTATSAHFLTSLDFVRQYTGVSPDWRPSYDPKLQMNERWICEWSAGGLEIQFMKKSDIFSGIRSQLAEPVPSANAQDSGEHHWRSVRVGRDIPAIFSIRLVSISYVCLQPGNSSRLVVETKDHSYTDNHRYAVYFVDLSRGEVISKIDTGPDLNPASWCGGTFIFLRELRDCNKTDGMFQAGLRIRIRIPIGFGFSWASGSGSRRAKMTNKSTKVGKI